MEFAIYGGQARRLGVVVAAAMLGMLGAMTPMMVARRWALGPAEVALMAWPAVLVLALVALVQTLMGARVCIDAAGGMILRLYPLLGWTLARRAFRPSDFDRVSLGRGYRSGYRVDLVGAEKDLLVSYTSALPDARERAHQVAAALRLEVVDRL